MRFLKRFVYASGSLLIIAVVALCFAVRASLPQLDGERALAGLTAPVHVSRDETGVVTIRAVENAMRRRVHRLRRVARQVTDRADESARAIAPGPRDSRRRSCPVPTSTGSL